MTIDYTVLQTEIINLMADHKNMALATSAERRTTCRMVSVVTDGLDVYFQTSANSLKYKQIADNPNVALCFGNVSFEGTAEILGHPLAEAVFCDQYRATHPHSFERYSLLQEERVIYVRIKLAVVWKYIDGKPCQEILDPGRPSAGRIWINTSRRINESRT